MQFEHLPTTGGVIVSVSMEQCPLTGTLVVRFVPCGSHVVVDEHTVLDVPAEVVDFYDLPTRPDADALDRVARSLRLEAESQMAAAAGYDVDMTSSAATTAREAMVADRLAALTRNRVGRRIEFASPRGAAGKYHVLLSCNGRDFSAPLTHWHSHHGQPAGAEICIGFYDPASWLATAASPACCMTEHRTSVRVHGTGFVNTSRIVVRFGEAGDVNGAFDKATGDIVVLAPDIRGPATVELLVSSGDGVFVGSAGTFRFYAPPKALELNLTLLPAHAPSAVVARGRGIFVSSASSMLFCPHTDGPEGEVQHLSSFGERNENNVLVTSSYVAWREALLDARAVVADVNREANLDDDAESLSDVHSTDVSSDAAAAAASQAGLGGGADVPGASSSSSLMGALQCLSPIGMSSDRVDVYVSLDGEWFTRVGRPLLLYSIDGGTPNLGPIAGNTCLTISGTNLDAVRELQATSDALEDAGPTTPAADGRALGAARLSATPHSHAYVAIVRFSWAMPRSALANPDATAGSKRGGSQRKTARHGVGAAAPATGGAGAASHGGAGKLRAEDIVWQHVRVQGVFAAGEVICATPPCPQVVLDAARALSLASTGPGADQRAAAALSAAALMATVELSLDGGRSFTADNHKFRYYEPPVVGSLTPEVAAVSGGTRVVVTGSGFPLDLPTYVRLCDGADWSADVPGSVSSDTSLSFVAPEFAPSHNGGAVAVLLSLNSQQWSGSGGVPEVAGLLTQPSSGPKVPSAPASRPGPARPMPPSRRAGGISDAAATPLPGSALVLVPPAILCYLPAPRVTTVFPHVGTRTAATHVEVVGRFIAVGDCTSVQVALTSGVVVTAQCHTAAASAVAPSEEATAHVEPGRVAAAAAAAADGVAVVEGSVLPHWMQDLSQTTSGDEHIGAALAAYAMARFGASKAHVPGAGRRDAALRGPMFRAQSTAGAVSAASGPRAASRGKSRTGLPAPQAVALHGNFLQVLICSCECAA